MPLYIFVHLGDSFFPVLVVKNANVLFRARISDNRLVVLRKRTYTGEEISRMSYIEIFDGLDRRRTLKGGKDD